MDKIGVNFKCVQMLKDRSCCSCLPIQLPIGAETELEGIIDPTMEEWVYRVKIPASWVCQPIRER
jgi:elongation factor G